MGYLPCPEGTGLGEASWRRSNPRFPQDSQEGALPPFTRLHTGPLLEQGCGSVGDVDIQDLRGACEQ